MQNTKTNRGKWKHLKIIHKIPEEHKGEQEIKEQQKTAIPDTVYCVIQTKLLKFKVFNKGNGSICTVNCNYRTAATLCALDIWVVSDI